MKSVPGSIRVDSLAHMYDMYAFTQKVKRIHTCVYIYTHIHIHMCICVCIYIYVDTYVCVLTCMHIHSCFLLFVRSSTSYSSAENALFIWLTISKGCLCVLAHAFMYSHNKPRGSKKDPQGRNIPAIFADDMFRLVRPCGLLPGPLCHFSSFWTNRLDICAP